MDDAFFARKILDQGFWTMKILDQENFGPGKLWTKFRSPKSGPKKVPKMDPQMGQKMGQKRPKNGANT